MFLMKNNDKLDVFSVMINHDKLKTEDKVGYNNKIL